MSSLSEAKKALQLNQEFVQLFGILKGVAASQFQTLMRSRQRFELFLKSFDGFFRLVNLVDTESPFVTRQSEATGVVIVTSDEGFMRGLNAKVIDKALEAAGSGQKELVVLGGRGADALGELKRPHTAFPAMVHEKRYEQAVKLTEYIVDLVVRKKVGRVIVVYPYPSSLMVQKPEVVHLLPCGELLGGLASPPPTGKAGLEPPPQRAFGADFLEKRVIVESSIQMIIQQLVGTWITYRLCDLFQESRLAELAARAMHLEQSHQRLTQQGKILRHRYFRSRRELIDKGIRETFGSILLQRKLGT